MNQGLLEVPTYPNLRIDKMYNVYIVDENMNVLSTFLPSDVKFTLGGKIVYVMDIVHITFYGVYDVYKFDSYERISPNEIVSNDVVFRQIPDTIDGYMISANGVVYSTFTNMILKQEIDDDGYHRISFPYPNFTHMAIHRMVYKAWKGAIPKGYVIHHRDNIKWHNDIDNLQITTPFLNSRYAAEDGQYKRTFDWTSDIVHQVCKLMENDVSVRDIAALYGVYPENKVVYKNFRNQLYNFRKHQRSWMDITSQYNFNDYTGNIRPDSKYRDQDIRDMRNMYNSGESIEEIWKKYHLVPRSYLVSLIKGRKRKRVE